MIKETKKFEENAERGRGKIGAKREWKGAPRGGAGWRIYIEILYRVE